MKLDDFKLNRPAKISQNSKKLLTFIFFISFLMFVKLAPYGNTSLMGDTLSKQIFILYFFIVNQTLGIVHEGGHGICYILGCPEFITALNGTVFQLLFPFLVGFYYKKRGQFFVYLIGLFFLGISLYYTAWYISTAGEGLYLPASKSFLGVDGLHDFNFILSKMHLLSYHKFIAGFVRFIAMIVMIYSVGYMFYLAFFASKKSIKERDEIKR